jgi:hypothetical protein
MGIGYPHYSINQVVNDTVIKLLDEITAEAFQGKDLNRITRRPIRPEEINVALAVATRIYNTTAITAAYLNVLNAAAAAVVPAGSIIVFLGWIVIDDPANPIGQDCVVRVLINGVVRQECCASLVNLQENNALLLLDQVCIAEENSNFNCQIKCPTNAAAGANAIAYPLAFRIGPREQLDVS